MPPSPVLAQADVNVRANAGNYDPIEPIISINVSLMFGIDATRAAAPYQSCELVLLFSKI